MDEPLIVSREIDLDLPAEELWRLLADGEGWAHWLVDDAEVAIEPGATGVVRDAGRDLDVRVEEVVEGERVSFKWWPTGCPHDSSAVELVVLPTPSGAVLHVTEVFPPQRSVMASVASMTWEVRAVMAWACAAAYVRT